MMAKTLARIYRAIVLASLVTGSMLFCDFGVATDWMSLTGTAYGAQWVNDQGLILHWPGHDNDSGGFSMMRYNAFLEDGTKSEGFGVLECHPRWAENGAIEGRYSLKIPDNSVFVARVGLLQGASLSDGVVFRLLWKRSGSRTRTDLTPAHYEYYDGKTSLLRVDLSSIDGQNGELILRVEAGLTSTQDWAFWDGAIIIEPCEQDTPAASGFDNSGAWHPKGNLLQVADQTVGTRESCMIYGGKPYYQMQLGCIDWWRALWQSCQDGNPGRQAWCSETVAYWHRQSGVPYEGGYKTYWHPTWTVTCTKDLRVWYQTEEIKKGSRGRWIDGTELDYDDFKPGVNALAPGAYQAWMRWDSENELWVDEDCHSQVIEEMKIFRQGDRIVRVDVKVVEGNNGGVVTNSTWYENVIDYTLLGDKAPDGRKIVGWGIDLKHGSPIIWNDKIKYYRTSAGPTPPVSINRRASLPKISDVDAPLVQQLVNYSKAISAEKLNVKLSGAIVRGLQVDRTESLNISIRSQDLVKSHLMIEIDQKVPYPLPIKSVRCSWTMPEGTKPPLTKIRLAGADRKYSSFSRESPKIARFIEIEIPKGSLAKDAILESVDIEYDWGPDTDSDIPVLPVKSENTVSTAPVFRQKSILQEITPQENSS